MAWVKEFSAASSSSNQLLVFTVPAGGIASGNFLALGLGYVASGSAPSSWAISDSRGNNWSINPTYGTKVLTGTFGGATLATCVVSISLQAGDNITAVASGGTVTRIAGVIEEFDDPITGFDAGSSNDNSGSVATSITSGSFATTQPNELLLGVVYFVNVGRTYTPDAGWTAGTKIATTNGTGDRAVIMQWQSVSSAGLYASTGTININGQYVALGAGYTISAGGARTGKAKVWNGTAWVAHPTKVWDGSSWVPHKAKGYSGTGWVIGK